MAATAAGAGVSGVAAAGAVDYSSAFSHESVLTSTTTFAQINRGSMSELEYIDDSGNVEDLSSTHGLRLAPRPETEDDTVVAHNPVEVPLDAIESDEFTAFPRETYELDADGNPDEDLPVSWTDAAYWSGTAVSEDGDGILFSGTAGSSATFSHSEWSITEDERRHYLTVVLDVQSLGTGAVLSIEASDSSGSNPSAIAKIDDAGDPAADDVIATSTGNGIAYQIPLGNLEPGVAEIDEVVLSLANAAADVKIHGLNLDRTSELVFGEQEVVETDDDGNESLATETVTRHNAGGPLPITSLSTMGSALGSATLRDVVIDVEQRARDLPSDLKTHEVADTPAGYSYEDRVTLGATHTLPAAYDLDHNVTGVVLRGALPSDRYFDVGYSTPSESPETASDYQDLTITSVASSLDPAADEPEVELVSSIVADSGIDVVVDMALASDETDSLFSGGGGGGTFALGASGGGGGGPIGKIRGAILVIASIVSGWIAYTRGAFSG